MIRVVFGMQGARKKVALVFKSILVLSSFTIALNGGENLSFFNTASAQNTSACFGQPTTDLDFSNPTLIAGADLQVGARYRFSNIIGNGSTDGIIEILNFANGASLGAIDTNAINPSNFQPELNAALNVDSGVDFRIEFVTAGTVTPIFLDVAINSIDVDGNGDPAGGGAVGNLQEYVEYETTLNAFVLNDPTELQEATSSAGDRIRFESSTTQFAAGINPTITENIVAGLYTNVSNFEFRIGATQAGAAAGPGGAAPGANTRLTSLGFTCPNFPNPEPEIEANPNIEVTKLADVDLNVAVGTTVTYTYDVTNTGDVTLNNINLNDAHNGNGAPPVPSSETLQTDVAPAGNSSDSVTDGVWDTLAPGDTVRFTSTYIVTQSDVDLLQ